MVHRPVTAEFEPPYAPAIITLDEGYQMLTNIVGVAPEDLAVGMRVQVQFHAGGSGRHPAVLHRTVVVSPLRTSSGLPVTAYLVLGVLAANDEQLTAGEIKTRAELSVGHFYWSPSVSHVRRELNRLLARGMVSEIGAQSGKRAITLYETTDAGRDALRRWVQHFPGQDQVVIKHPVILQDLAGPRRGSRTHRRHLGSASRGDPGSAGRGAVVAAAVPRTGHRRRS